MEFNSTVDDILRMHCSYHIMAFMALNVNSRFGTRPGRYPSWIFFYNDFYRHGERKDLIVLKRFIQIFRALHCICTACTKVVPGIIPLCMVNPLRLDHCLP